MTNLKTFNKKFVIQIKSYIIKKNKLEKYYISKFDYINKNNIKYSIKFYYKKTQELYYLKMFNISKLDNIHSLFFEQKCLDHPCTNDLGFQTIVSTFNTFDNNLINFGFEYYQCIFRCRLKKLELYTKINNFQNLEYLNLRNFIFNRVITFKLNNLKKLILFCCQNISFESDSLLKLKHLYLQYSKIVVNPLLKLPNLETIELNAIGSDYLYGKYELVIDFQSLKKLKSFKGHKNYFLLLNNTSIENIHILGFLGVEKEIIEKLNSIQKKKI